MPLKIPHDTELAPTIEKFQHYKVDWEEELNETSRYEFYMLCPTSKAFPNRVISYRGDGRVTAVDITVRPLAMTDVVYRPWTQRLELDGLHHAVRTLTRKSELIEHNAAVLARELAAIPDIAEQDQRRYLQHFLDRHHRLQHFRNEHLNKQQKYVNQHQAIPAQTLQA